jgi:hypothetical protein
VGYNRGHWGPSDIGRDENIIELMDKVFEMGNEDDEDAVADIDDGDEDESPNTILGNSLELLNVENNVQLVSMLMRYKQKKMGKKRLLKSPLN